MQFFEAACTESAASCSGFLPCFAASVSRAQPIDRSRFISSDFPIGAIVGRDCRTFCTVSNKQLFHTIIAPSPPLLRPLGSTSWIRSHIDPGPHGLRCVWLAGGPASGRLLKKVSASSPSTGLVRRTHKAMLRIRFRSSAVFVCVCVCCSAEADVPL